MNDKVYKGLTIGIDVEGKDKLQDVADIVRDVQERVTIRDNETVNVYISNTVFLGGGE